MHVGNSFLGVYTAQTAGKQRRSEQQEIAFPAAACSQVDVILHFSEHMVQGRLYETVFIYLFLSKLHADSLFGEERQIYVIQPWNLQS